MSAITLTPLTGARGEESWPPALAGAPQARAAVQAMREARERRLRDERRAVEGRIQTLDRRLDLRVLERAPASSMESSGVPAPLQDPVTERLRLERRGLRDRDHLLEQRLRNEQFDRERMRRMRSW